MLAALVRKTGMTASSSRLDHGKVEFEIQNLIASGSFPAAESKLRTLIYSNARDAQLHRLLGTVLGADGRPAEAVEVLERALTLDPDSPAGLALLGNAYWFSGRADAAEPHFRRALALDWTSVAARFGVACIDEHRGRFDAAKEGYAALLSPPAFPPALQALIRMLLAAGDEEQSKAVCAAVLGREPEHGAAHAALGFLLLNRDLKAQAALEHLERALQAGYDSGEVLANRNVARGIALQEQGEIQPAMASFDAALQVQPNYSLARFHRSLAMLLRGDFKNGWPDYEARLASEQRAIAPRELPRWRGESLPQTTLLIYGEQGIGDEIMFASCLPDLLAKCPSVVLSCAPKLTAIMRRSFTQVEVVSSASVATAETAKRLDHARLMSPIGSLPLYLRPTLAHFPRHSGYLRVDPAVTEHYRRRLQSLGPGPKVGFSWRGGTPRSRKHSRSLGQTQIDALLTVPGIRFVNVQHDSAGDEPEIHVAVRSGRLAHWPDVLLDYDHTAALVSCLDVVVSVCTAVIHLAGALGRPAWVMTPYSPEWRYGNAGETMPWYPSVELIRQTAPGDWGAVVIAVQKRLHALCVDPRYSAAARGGA